MDFTKKTPLDLSTSLKFIFSIQFFSIAFSHFMTDLYLGQRSVYLAFIANQTHMSNATLGLITTLAVVGAGLSQPIFGWIADKIGARRMILIALIWTTLLFTLSTLLPIGVAGLLFILANLGAGMYHPAGVSQATLIGRARLVGRETTAASYFFLFGQLGFFIGPLVGGFLLAQGGQLNLLWLVLLAIPAFVFVSSGLKQLPVQRKPSPADVPFAQFERSRPKAAAVIALILVAIFYAWSTQNVTAFVPKHVADLGLPASIYGLLASIFIGGTVIGNLVGGALADKIGKRLVILGAMGLASLPMLALAMVPYSGWWFLLLFLAGALTGAAYSSLVVLGQRLAPGGGALASGLVLGFIFSAGALGAAFTGIIADTWGFTPVYYLSAGLVLLGGLSAFGIRE